MGGLIVLLGMGGGACTGGDSGLSRVPASSFFNPSEIEFGLRTVGQQHELMLVIRNGSADTLRVQETRFEPARDVYQALLAEGGTLRGTLLRPGESRDVIMRYAPIAEGQDDTTMFVEFDEIEVALPITAEARQVAAGRPRLTPTNVTFLGTEVGRDVMQVVTIENVGDTQGAIRAVRGQRGPFSVTALGGAPMVLPLDRLAPGESTQVEVHYAPTVQTPLAASLVFEMDTEQSETLMVTGEAVEAGTLSCNQISLDYGMVPRGEVRRRSVSCQASGGPYELAELRVVPGSAAGFSIPNAPSQLDVSRRIAFEVEFDAGGLPRRYDGALEIVAAHGAITRIPIVAITTPPLEGTTDLTVSIEWNTARSDIDLHLVRVGGTPFAMGHDCYFGDKNPDWGQSMTEVDDPFLDVDDFDGLGPEEVNLSTAAETHYELYVQYYGYQGAFAPSTTIDVRYRMRGQGPQTISRDMSDCGELWFVGTFYFDGGTPRFEAEGTVTDSYKIFADQQCR